MCSVVANRPIVGELASESRRDFQVFAAAVLVACTGALIFGASGCHATATISALGEAGSGDTNLVGTGGTSRTNDGSGGATGAGGATGDISGGAGASRIDGGGRDVLPHDTRLEDFGADDGAATDAGAEDLRIDDRNVADSGNDALSGCQGNETFTAARAAMLNTCGSGTGQFCHTGSGTVLVGGVAFGGGLNLNPAVEYANLVGVAAVAAPTKLLVKPFSPGDSFLVQKLTNQLKEGEGSPMPGGESILWQPPDAARLKVLTCWIALGGANN